MHKRVTSPELAQRIQQLEKAIKANERHQRRLQRAMAKGKPLRAPSLRPVEDPRPPSQPLPERQPFDDRPVKFDRDNAPIFMSGSLEALDVRHVTPTERRNRFLLLLIFAMAVLVGIIYMLWP